MLKFCCTCGKARHRHWQYKYETYTVTYQWVYSDNDKNPRYRTLREGTYNLICKSTLERPSEKLEDTRRALKERDEAIGKLMKEDAKLVRLRKLKNKGKVMCLCQLGPSPVSCFTRIDPYVV